MTLTTPIDSPAIPATGGQALSLGQFRGKKLLVYFYPKDNTPGCTNESIAFRDIYPHLVENNVEVLGVSRDSLKSHDTFKAKYQLPFPLLADTESQLCNQFDVIKEKSMYGRKMMGVCRSTFLFNEEGNLVKEWRNVTVDGHSQAVLDELGINVTVGPASCQVPQS